MCQIRCRLLQGLISQTREAGFQVRGINVDQVAVDLQCLLLGEGDAAVTKREGRGHVVWGVWYVRILQGQQIASGEAVTVDPLSYAHGSDHDGRQDLAAGHASEAILLAATTEADLNSAHEGVGVHGAGSTAELGINGEHGSSRLVDLISLQGQAGGRGHLGDTPSGVTSRSGILPLPPDTPDRWRSDQRSGQAPCHRTSEGWADHDPLPGSAARKRWGCSGSWSLSFGM